MDLTLGDLGKNFKKPKEKMTDPASHGDTLPAKRSIEAVTTDDEDFSLAPGVNTNANQCLLIDWFE